MTNGPWLLVADNATRFWVKRKDVEALKGDYPSTPDGYAKLMDDLPGYHDKSVPKRILAKAEAEGFDRPIAYGW